MIDLFEIINSRKSHRLNIKGMVSDLNVIPYTTKDINSLTAILLDKRAELDVKTFDVSKEDAVISRRSIVITDTYERLPIDAITFDIDIYMNAKLYNEIYSEFEDFIDYFTVGSIKYDTVSDEIMTTIDESEDYVSGIVNANLYDLITQRDINTPNYDWWSSLDGNSEITSSIGSYPRSHDADGDVLSYMEFDADFRPTDISNMFSNMVLSLDNIPRPVIDRGNR